MIDRSHIRQKIIRKTFLRREDEQRDQERYRKTDSTNKMKDRDHQIRPFIFLYQQTVKDRR